MLRDDLIAELMRYPNLPIRLSVREASIDWELPDSDAENEAQTVQSGQYSGSDTIIILGGKWER